MELSTSTARQVRVCDGGRGVLVGVDVRGRRGKYRCVQLLPCRYQ